MNIYLILLILLPISILCMGRKVAGKYKYAAVFLLCSVLVWLLMFMFVEEQYYLDTRAGDEPSSDEKNMILGMILFGGWLGAILYSAVIALLIKLGFYAWAQLRTKT